MTLLLLFGSAGTPAESVIAHAGDAYVYFDAVNEAKGFEFAARADRLEFSRTDNGVEFAKLRP